MMVMMIAMTMMMKVKMMDDHFDDDDDEADGFVVFSLTQLIGVVFLGYCSLVQV